MSLKFSKHCAYCKRNKTLIQPKRFASLLRLLKECLGYLDRGDYEGNEVQFSLAQEIEEELKK